MPSAYSASRRFPRVPAERPVLFRVLGQDQPLEDLAKTRVLGLGGCCFVTDQSVGFGSLMEVLISFRGRVIRTDGRVAYERPRTDRRYEVGIEFLRLPAEDRAYLEGQVTGGLRTIHA
jgi:hypothetical protein